MEFFDCGSTRVVLLKKCASSSLRAMTQHRRRGQWVTASRYVVTWIRDPYTRILSGWADLAVRCNHSFAIPRTLEPVDVDVFAHWLREIVKIEDDELDHHFRPQHLEILDALELADMMHNCQLIIGKLEHLHTHLPAMQKYVGGEPINPEDIVHRRKSQHLDASAYYVDDDLRARVHQKFWRDEVLHAKLGADVYISPPGEPCVEHFKSLIYWDK